MDEFEKKKLSLRYWLLGKGYYTAVDALEFAASYHTGMRKDKKTPEFQHQIEIAHYVRTLALVHPELTIAASLLHDVREDYDVSDAELRRRFGDDLTDICITLDKNGKTVAAYYAGCAGNIITSVVKGCDRIHNLQSMPGVFSKDKQRAYIRDVQDLFFPMLKSARRSFPQQEAAYENIKYMLTSQIYLLEAALSEPEVSNVS